MFFSSIIPLFFHQEASHAAGALGEEYLSAFGGFAFDVRVDAPDGEQFQPRVVAHFEVVAQFVQGTGQVAAVFQADGYADGGTLNERHFQPVLAHDLEDFRQTFFQHEGEVAWPQGNQRLVFPHDEHRHLDGVCRGCLDDRSCFARLPERTHV